MTLDVPSVKWAVTTAPAAAKQCSWQPTLNRSPARTWCRPRHGVGAITKSPAFLLGPGDQVPECAQVDGQVCACDPVADRGPNQAGAGPALPPPLGPGVPGNHCRPWFTHCGRGGSRLCLRRPRSRHWCLGPGLGLGTQRGWGDRTKHPRAPCRTSCCLQEGSGGPSLPPDCLSPRLPPSPRGPGRCLHWHLRGEVNGAQRPGPSPAVGKRVV